MGVIRTDEWLSKDFQDPLEICKNWLKEFNETDPENIYDYLLSFGMYKPSRSSWYVFQELNRKKVWEVTEKLLNKYQKMWDGPDISIYIFPMNQIYRQTPGKGVNKSGISFRDRMYLFLTPFDDFKELEALFIHEYHHVCRLNKQKKDIDDYTLLDSMILEGLAEFTVLKYCGEDYIAHWCKYYTNKELENFWNKFLKEGINVKKREALHDQLLYGFEGYPRLVGYATGYQIVCDFMHRKSFSTKATFHLESEIFNKKNIKFS
ncbi:DUF2268 domain-containing putative Zn-dependent protease [Bacillus sp. 31A1R]|uniref:DUF2268 domain-containing putative Zn-dependent protease n=1 Tax=Robertmurraya mangrovi TaxID=3098077 RepID=A0ABU5IT60_9BACI|nr:DUF2268 domain-containing putative Zn-dependent protease [Bacillus sp. 31A1R]MDZ5470337.1 DUF2268 domain-containing putative Zn-dependent protease [Bacillus sp. 31A1R]